MPKKTVTICQVVHEHLPPDTKDTKYVWCSCGLLCRFSEWENIS